MATLADLAKKAWTNQPAEVKAEAQKLAAEAFNDPLVSKSKVYDFWRKRWQLQSVGKESTPADRHEIRSSFSQYPPFSHQIRSSVPRRCSIPQPLDLCLIMNLS